MYFFLAIVASLAVFAAPSAAITDIQILNFALNLECLEVISNRLYTSEIHSDTRSYV